MKGIVFTEFLSMVENQFGLAAADGVLRAIDSETDGAYTSVGTYEHTELLQMVVQLCERADVAMPTLVRTFGQHLFARFALVFPIFFEGAVSTFPWLRSVEGFIHQEVLKLYPDAELPSLVCTVEGAEYRSTLRVTGGRQRDQPARRDATVGAAALLAVLLLAACGQQIVGWGLSPLTDGGGNDDPARPTGSTAGRISATATRRSTSVASPAPLREPKP